MEETIFFHRRLREQQLPFGGLVVNRVRPESPDAGDELAEELTSELGEDLARRVARTAHEASALGARDAAGLARLKLALGDPPLVAVPQLPGDVHDLEGLAHVCEHLFGGGVAAAV